MWSTGQQHLLHNYSDEDTESTQDGSKEKKTVLGLTDLNVKSKTMKASEKAV